MICTFFGHRDAPDSVKRELYDVLECLIENKNANCFFVGNQGKFDVMVIECLKKLKEEHPHIKCTVVLAYFPQGKRKTEYENCFDTLYPEELENTPYRFAVLKRNKWLVENSDLVVTYVKHYWSGAAQSREYALKHGKTVIDL